MTFFTKYFYILPSYLVPLASVVKTDVKKEAYTLTNKMLGMMSSRSVLRVRESGLKNSK